MAGIDYGAIALKNKELISHEDYMDMREMVGWKTKEADVHIGWIGDKNLAIGFGRHSFTIYVNKKLAKRIELQVGFRDWKRYGYYHSYGQMWVRIEVFPQRGGHYKAIVRLPKDFTYKEVDEYTVYFGYGVDHEYYLKSGKPNLYNSIPERWSDFKWRMKDGLRDIFKYHDVGYGLENIKKAFKELFL